MPMMKRKKMTKCSFVSHRLLQPNHCPSVHGNDITESCEGKYHAASAAPTSFDGLTNPKLNQNEEQGVREERWTRSTGAKRFRDPETFDFRWKTVMGKRRSVCSSISAVTPLISLGHLHLWQIITFIFIITIGTSQSCKVDQCWRHYSRDMEQQGIIQGSNREYCHILKTHSECIRATARSCRGDLKYHSTSSLVMQWTQEYNCSYVILNSASTPPVTKVNKPTECTYLGKPEYLHCALFGDPHLRTFQDESQTCKVLGAWPLVDNAFLAVQVTNEAVYPESSVTATTKVTVIIKSSGNNCAHHKTYEAQVDNVSSAFIDGTTGYGQGDERYVRIKEKSPAPYSHVEIVIRYIATTIVIRQTGRYLTVAIRMPANLVRQGVSPGVDGMQLCYDGCPAKEKIAYKKMLAMPSNKLKTTVGRPEAAVSREEAVAKCKEYNVTDFYFDSCVFDLMATGDLGFGEAASRAQHDLWRLNPRLAAQQRNRTILLLSPEPEDGDDVGSRPTVIDSQLNSGPGRPQSSFALHVSCVVIVIVAVREFLKVNLTF